MKQLKKIITLGHDKGGVGKSTTAINIAVELNKEYDLTVIDLDPKKQFTLFNSNRQEDKKIKQFEVSDIKSLVSFAKEYDGLIIIDLGGFDSNFFRTALLITDLMITPLSASDNDIAGIMDFQKIILDVKNQQEKNGIDFDVTILVNRVHHANKSAHRALSQYAEKYDFNIFETVIRDNKEFGNMIFSGKSVSEQTKGTPAINLRKLTNEIKEKLEK